MLVARCSYDNFIYDVHSLIKAFYPSKDVKVFVDGEKDLKSIDAPEIYIEYQTDRSIISVYEGENKVESVESQICSEEDRPTYKNNLKLAIYNALSQYTGKKLPWGTLTGIRPTKIAVSMIEAGAADYEVLDYYKNVYTEQSKVYFQCEENIEYTDREEDKKKLIKKLKQMFKKINEQNIPKPKTKSLHFWESAEELFRVMKKKIL